MACNGGRPARAMRSSRPLMAGVSRRVGGCIGAKHTEGMAHIQYLTQIHLDPGVVRLLRGECERVGMRRPLVVTDAGVRAAGVLDQALAALGDLPHAVFDGTPSNPTEAGVRAACRVLEAERCDGLVAVGGGSSIDLAKGVAIAATHDGALRTY